jgi:hypothetical protein
MSEEALHKSIVSLLRRTLDDRVLWWHTPNGGLRNVREAAKFKAMGVLPGVADLIFIWNRELIFGGSKMNVPDILAIELKSKPGTVTGSQTQFGDDLIALGGKYVIIRSMEDFFIAARIFKLPFKNSVNVQ